MYLVVIEKLTRKGENGRRLYIDFNTKANFEEKFSEGPYNGTILARGITQKKARLLCAQTPIIQIIKGFIDECTDDKGHFDQNRYDLRLNLWLLYSVPRTKLPTVSSQMASREPFILPKVLNQLYGN